MSCGTSITRCLIFYIWSVSKRNSLVKRFKHRPFYMTATICDPVYEMVQLKCFACQQGCCNSLPFQKVCRAQIRPSVTTRYSCRPRGTVVKYTLHASTAHNKQPLAIYKSLCSEQTKIQAKFLHRLQPRADIQTGCVMSKQSMPMQRSANKQMTASV